MLAETSDHGARRYEKHNLGHSSLGQRRCNHRTHEVAYDFAVALGAANYGGWKIG